MKIDSGVETPIQTFYDGPLFDPLGTRAGLLPISGVPPCGLAPFEADLSQLVFAGTTRRFGVQPSGSFFGDCIRVVDVPDEQPLAPGLPVFGWSGTDLLGGAAITASRLRGEIELRFGDAVDGRLPFVVNCPQPLIGGDGILAAPAGYELPTSGNEVSLVGPPSRGLLEPATGRVYDFHFNCEFRNSAIHALLAQNPALDAPPLLFPGVPHSGHALAWFAISDEFELQFHLAAQLFLPLGAGTQDMPLRMPASPGSKSYDTPFQARNSALHPFIYLSCSGRADEHRVSRESRHGPTSSDADGLGEVLRSHENTVLTLLCWPTETCFGDDFDLVTDDLGGGALAQSPLFGRLEVQIGRIVDGFAPFSLSLLPPSAAYEPKFAPLLRLLPPGTHSGLVGMRGALSFPNHEYDQRNLSLNSDPYKPSVGIVDVTTGRFTMVLREYLFQDLMMHLLVREPRTPSDSFAYVASGAFGDADGLLTLDLEGALFIPYPTGYRFPLPDGGTTTAQDGSRLVPFVRLDAIEHRALRPLASDRALKFAGTRHVRGRQADIVTFDVTPLDPRSGRRRVSLRIDEALVEGHGDVGQHALYGDRLLVTAEFIVDGEAGGICTYYLTIAQGEAQLQIISSDENWDLWFQGESEQAVGRSL